MTTCLPCPFIPHHAAPSNSQGQRDKHTPPSPPPRRVNGMLACPVFLCLRCYHRCQPTQQGTPPHKHMPLSVSSAECLCRIHPPSVSPKTLIQSLSPPRCLCCNHMNQPARGQKPTTLTPTSKARERSVFHSRPSFLYLLPPEIACLLQAQCNHCTPASAGSSVC